MKMSWKTWLAGWLAWGRRHISGGKFGLANRIRLNVSSLEERVVPAAPPWAVSLGGAGTQVTFSPGDAQPTLSYSAYEPEFVLGSRTAVGDVTGDGVADLVTAAGFGGGPRVIVFDGTSGAEVSTFFAYEEDFRGGAFAAVGDVDGDGWVDIITGAGETGGPRVRAFSGRDGRLLRDLFVYGADFRWGVRVAAADVDGDGSADILTAPGVGGSARVIAISGATGEVLADFQAGSPDARGGAFVAAGDFDGDKRADIVVGAGVGERPTVTVYSGATNAVLRTEEVYEPSFRGGVQVALAGYVDGRAESVWTAAGDGGGPRVRRYAADTWRPMEDRFVFDPALRVGVTVAAGFIPRPAGGPTATADRTATPYETPVVVPVLANDSSADGSPLRLLSVSAPQAGEARLVGNDVRYAPRAGFSGADRFLYTVVDGRGRSATGEVVVTVAARVTAPPGEPPVTVPPDNRPPTAVDDAATTAFQTAVLVDVLRNDSDPDGDGLRIASAGNPAHGLATVSAAGITYTPAGGYCGTDQFAYTVADGRGGSGTAVVRVVIAAPPVSPPPANRPPVVQDDAVTTDFETPLTIAPLVNDSDPDGDTLRLTAVSGVSSGEAAVVGDAVVFTPAAGFVGRTVFRYTATDGTAAADGTIAVTVRPRRNGDPRAADDSAVTPFETPVAVDVLRNDTDPDGDALTLSAVGGAAHGFAEIVGGRILYTPAAGFAGEDAFSYAVEDGRGGTAAATVSVTVAPPIDFVAGWTAAERGGSAGRRGGVTQSRDAAVLREGDSFVTTLSKSFVIPASPASLNFSYAQLAFDGRDAGFVNDAFEAALLDAGGNSVVPTFGPDRDAFWNLSEGAADQLASGVTVAGTTVSVDLSGVPAGTVATLTFRLVNNDADAGSAVTLSDYFVPVQTALAAPKFFVVDDQADRAFRYGDEGIGGGAFPATADPRGAASNPAGDTVWVADRGAKQVVVYRPDGAELGRWAPADVAASEGVSVVDGRLWLVDRAARQVLRYDGGALLRAGSAAATAAFPLAAGNAAPSDLVSDGSTVWVTDDAAAAVFVYDVSGAPLGRWDLDADNAAPSGVTRNPAGGTDLWVLDRTRRAVFHYPAGANARGGRVAAAGTFNLAPENGSPEGIADPPPAGAVPPAVTASSTALNGGAPQESTLLISGQALAFPAAAGAAPNRIVAATVNGVPVDALDAAGGFFAYAGVLPGENRYRVVATDAYGQTASSDLTVYGRPPAAGSVDPSQLVDLTPGFRAEYARTSFRDATRTLFADVAVRNVGRYPAGVPLYVGVKNISDPAVRVLDAAGTLADGTPYYDFTGLVSGGATQLAPDAATGILSLAFANPNRGRFTYDLVYLGVPNRPPAFTTVPEVEATVGREYRYAAVGTDPDGDPLTFALVGGPPGMAVDASTGSVAWTPTPAQVGNFPVTLLVSDGRGGAAEQTFTVSSAASRPNRPPVFTSTPVGGAQAGRPYAYDADAVDPDRDTLTYSLAAGFPAGMAIDAGTGVISWTPGFPQIGDAEVTVVADDGRGGAARQAFTICVENDANRPPVIVSVPGTIALSQTTPAIRSSFSQGLEGWTPSHRPDEFSWVSNGGHPGGYLRYTQIPIPAPAYAIGPSKFHGSWANYAGGVFSFDQKVIDPGPNIGRRLEREIILSGPGGVARWIGPVPLAQPSDWMTFNVPVTEAEWIIESGGWGALLENVTDVRIKVELFANTSGSDISGLDNVVLTPPELPAYRYDAEAIDNQGEVITYTLTQSPVGMTINQSTGVVSWAPVPEVANQSFPVTVRADDGRGGSDEQRFTVTVTSEVPPAPPVVGPPPDDNFVIANTALRLRLPVEDPDGDSLGYEIVSGPSGLMVHLTLGVVAWVPKRSEVGTYQVVVKATDAVGNITLVPFAVTVVAPNSPPVITSIAPAGPASVGQTLEYRVTAQDAETAQAALRYSLRDALPGMAIDATTGVFTWTPAAGQVGVRTVTVVVSDGSTAGVQSFPLEVVAASLNRNPAVAPLADGSAWLGGGYGVLVAATDPDGDPVRFTLVRGPAGMAVDPVSGIVRWTPTAVTAAPEPVEVLVSDGRGGTAAVAFTVSVFAADRNRGPAVMSLPPRAAQVGRPYAYDLAARDPDGDDVLWQLVSGPQGVSLDPFRGTLRWTPAGDQTGPHVITVRVLDPLLAAAEQTFTVTVACENQPPAVVSRPPTLAYADDPYVYAVRAVDPEGDALAFAVESGPAGLAFVPGTSILRWTPTTTQAGPQAVVVRVTDAAGNAGRQEFTVVVSTESPNRPPVLTSRPITGATLGRTYQYAAEARDPEGDPLSFALTEGPAGMSISPAGILNWSPAAAGSHTVTVEVTDGRGGLAVQRFTLVARANTAPGLTPVPDADVVAGTTFRALAWAADAENDPLTFTLTRAPAGMTVDAQGRISWTASGPPRAEIVVLSVADPDGLAATDEFVVHVVADTLAPAVRIDLSPARAALGSTVRVTVAAADAVGVAAVALTADGVPVALDAQNRAFFPAARVGRIVFAAAATDAGGNTGSATADLIVVDPTLASDVRADITRLDALTAPGTVRQIPVRPDTPVEVSYLADVVGTVESLGNPLAEWRVLLARGDQVDVANVDPDAGYWRVIGSGTAAVVNGKLAAFDPTLLANDRYVIAVVAYDVLGAGYVKPVEVDVVGNAKLGEFRLEFSDLTIPLNGVPVEITRVYDTRDSAAVGDFGFGWTMGVRDARIRETVPADVSLVPDKSKVYLTAPDGSRVGFTYKERVVAGFTWGFGSVFAPYFVADPGNAYKLETPRDTTVARGGIIGAFGDGINPNFYRLTTPDGTAYDYDQTSGLQKIADKNGNTVTFTSTAITHSGGRVIALDRDGQGRITAIHLPDGSVAVRYRYDAKGDLVEVKQVTEAAPVEKSLVSAFTYRADRPHYLDEYTDANGKRAAKTEYDAAGRVVAIVDAKGNRTEQDFAAIANFAETVKDARGNPTLITYNDRGNVTKTLQPTEFGDIVTQYFYEDPANPDKETKVINPRGFATTKSYDARGNLLTETTPDGSTTYRFNSQDKLTSVTDTLDRVTVYSYSPSGNLVSVVNPLGDDSTFTYDALGRVATFTDFAGNTTMFQDYCACGSPLTTINPDGTIRRIETNGYSQVTKVTDERGHVTTNDYDQQGRLVRVVDGEGSATQYEYEGEYQVRVIDALGNVTQSGYDAAGSKTSIRDAENGLTRFAYDANGNLTSVTDPVNNVTRFVYDKANRLMEEIDPLAVSRYFEYDGAGNKTKITDRNGKVRTFTFDSLNRQTAEAWLAADGSRVRVIASSYDKAGNLLETSDPDALLLYSYDALNRLQTATTIYPGATVSAVTLTYGYDANGNRTSVIDNSDVRVDSVYGDRSELRSRTWSGGSIDVVKVAFEYFANGDRKSMYRYADATETVKVGSSTYDNYVSGLSKSIAHATGTNNVLVNYTYEYDEIGRLALESHHGSTYAYSYDNTGQLLAVTKDGVVFDSFNYDGNGNRLTSTGPNGNQSYGFAGPGNQLANDGLYAYTYDREGNLKTKRQLSTDDVIEYFWDARSRLVKLEQRTAEGVILSLVAYAYDSQDRRIFQNMAGELLWTVYDGAHTWSDLNQTGVVDSRYLFGDKIDEIWARWEPEEGIAWHLSDQLGSVRDVQNSTGVVVNHLDYAAFGEILSQSDPSLGDRFAFTGRESDALAGYYYRGRFYDSVGGRFVSRDPLGIGPDVNSYRYVANAPLQYTDPFGLTLVERVSINREIVKKEAVQCLGKELTYEFIKEGLYILLLSDNTLYIGQAGDTINRFKQHIRRLEKLGLAIKDAVAVSLPGFGKTDLERYESKLLRHFQDVFGIDKLANKVDPVGGRPSLKSVC